MKKAKKKVPDYMKDLEENNLTPFTQFGLDETFYDADNFHEATKKNKLSKKVDILV